MSVSELSLTAQFAATGYVVDHSLVTTLGLMRQLERPLLIEGEAGVGKTESAKALAEVTSAPLIRLQCYDGLDLNAAVYEWNYTRQLISIKLNESASDDGAIDVFSREFLMERPLLQSIQQPEPAVLLIDEIDRADEAFEAYLLELLSDFQISIPELGTIKAVSKPRVILTSNGTRELSDALRRRCLYHYMDYPGYHKELEIVLARLPDIDQSLGEQIVGFIQKIRDTELQKRPGVAETLDWAAALMGLELNTLQDNLDVILETRSCFLKTREDMAAIDRESVAEVITAVA
ncbi:MAG: MoxR family ATPase [Acidiferrobacterales bacterium]|nr:MoxR family ATPase [Acidiferrobacterales bacterium]